MCNVGQVGQAQHVGGVRQQQEGAGIQAGEHVEGAHPPGDGVRVEEAPMSNIRTSRLQGGPSHKDVIRSFFNAVRGDEDLPLQTEASWSDLQAAMRAFSKAQTGIEFLNDKEKNYLLVANILNNKEMMQSAASFFAAVARHYAGGEEVDPAIARVNKPEVRHGWPNVDTTGTLNQDERGWTGMAKDQAKHVVGMESRSLSEGLVEFQEKMEALAQKEGDLTLEEASFIVRGMAVLRDVMKAVKRTEVMDFVNANELPNMIVRNVEARGDLYRGRVYGADLVRQRDPSFSVPEGEGGGLKERVKEEYDTRFNPPVDEWGYDQGPSGATLDFLNFCEMFLVNHGGQALEGEGGAKEQSMVLMQVMYAYWHFCAPDGLAHGQEESLSTMLDAFGGEELTAPIVTPIRSFEDLREMRHTQHMELNYVEPVLERDEGQGDDANKERGRRTEHVQNGYQGRTE